MGEVEAVVIQDVSAQYTIGTEPVTLYDKFGNVIDTIANAKRLEQNCHEREISYGEYLENLVDFRLPAASVTETIYPGFSILDAASIAYVVLDIDPPSTMLHPWHCYCRQIQVLGLINQIDWRQVSQGTNVYGDRLTNSFPLKGHYPARIQPATAEILDILGKRGLLNHYVCYVVPDLELSYGDLIVDTSNQNATYKIVSWKSKQDLACALAILLEKLP